MDIFFLFVLLALFHPVLPFPTEEPELLRDCPKFRCGNSDEIGFPFTNNTQNAACGPFVVEGCDKEEEEQQKRIQLVRGPSKWYQLESINCQYPWNCSVSFTDTELQMQLNSSSCRSFNEWRPPQREYHGIELMPIQSMNLWKCDQKVDSISIPLSVLNYTDCPGFTVYYTDVNTILPNTPPLDKCSYFQLPLNISSSRHDNISQRLTAKFSFNVRAHFICEHCPLEVGTCHYDHAAERFQCIPAKDTGRRVGQKLAIALSVSGFGLLMGILYWFSRIFSSNNSIFCLKRYTQDSRSIEFFLENNGMMMLKRYKYAEVKKMTGSFFDKLGQGGYGTVFKGKLSDGRLVAVKILKDSKSNGEEFMNEVVSISRTSHVNIVTLLGFCFDGSKRALIYEFMSNGSLEKYIFREENNPLKHGRQLGWETLYQIAVGIARGLEYLHRGCSTRILHFDIKPHNILLDENLCPKISDFGLSKICPRKESIVSMIGARGTAGYIAPELFCRSFGEVSHKSDVYSYGMLVLEMVGGRRNLCATFDHTSEIYFPHWIFKRLELGDELGVHGICKQEDNQIARKMVVVSLWCIQTDPSNRPSITKVIEMLQGSNLESLPIPPKPYLSSPSRSPQRSKESSSTERIVLL